MIQWTQSVDLQAELGKAAAHDEIAPSLWQAVGQETMQASEFPPAGRMKAGLGRVEQARDRQLRSDRLFGLFQLSQTRGHGQSANGHGICCIVEGQARGQGSSRRQFHDWSDLRARTRTGGAAFAA